MRPTAKALALIPALMTVLASCVLAQESKPSLSKSGHDGYTLAAIGVPLSEALDVVIDQTEISLVYETHLVSGKTSFCKIEGAPPGALLGCILRGTGLDYVLLSSGTYVLRLDAETPPLRGGVVGQVVDAESGAPIAEANVIVAASRQGTATNSDGRFALVGLLPGPHELIVSHVAFTTSIDSIDVTPARTEQVSIAVEPRLLLSSPVVVTGFEQRLRSEALGSSRSAEGRLNPLIGAGTIDLSREIGAMLGVRAGEIASDIHVQGGGIDEQQFLLDGAPVFMPVPSGGFISTFNPFAVAQITVHKAGFGVEHGSHLSGVVDISHDLAEQPSASLRVDPLSLNAKVGGRALLQSGVDAVWMVSGRRALWDTYHPPQLGDLFRRWSRPDVFLRNVLESPGDRPVSTETGGNIDDSKLEVGFTDLHAATRLRFGALRSLKLTLYRGANSFGVDEVVLPESGDGIEFEDAYRWKNRAADVRYEWVASSRALMSAESWMSDYVLHHPSNLAGAGVSELTEESNNIRESGLRLTGDFALAARNTLYAGIEAVNTRSRFALALDPFGQTTAGPASLRPISWRLAGFVEERLGLGRSSTIEVGTRLTYLPAQENVFAEPRLALLWDGRRLSARAAVGLYRQFTHSFDVATFNVASLLPRVRFWLPVGRRQRPPKAYHTAAAVSFRPDEHWSGTFETFYKHQSHLLVLNYGAPSKQERPLLRGADGYASGLAVKISRRSETLDITAQYEYTVSKRRIDNRFGGRYVAAPWNAPHRVVASVDVVPISGVTFMARCQAARGRSWGFRQGYYDVLAPNAETRIFEPFDLSDPEAHRLPASLQIDAGAAYTRTMGPVAIQAGVYFVNVLGTRNVADWTLRYGDDTYERRERYGMPFLPIVSLTVRVSDHVPW